MQGDVVAPVGASRRRFVGGLVAAVGASVVAPRVASATTGPARAALPSVYVSGHGYLISEGVALDPGVLYAYRWVTEERRLDALGVSILASAGGASVRVAIFEDGPAGPGLQLAVASTLIGAQGSGIQVSALASPTELGAGAYWLGTVAQGATAGLRLEGHSLYTSDVGEPLFGSLPGSGRLATGVDSAIPASPLFSATAFSVPIVYVGDASEPRS